MELELERTELNGCGTILDTTVCREETLEAIVPDACPDILRICDVEGTVCLAGKEAQEGRVELSGTVRAGYVKYIKRNCERLVMDADCRRVILQEKYITARKIDDYLKEAKRCWREDVVRELLEYKEKNFS